MLIGTVLNEQAPSMFDAALESITEDEMQARAAKDMARRRRGGAAYRKAFPAVKPIELLSRMLSVRTSAVTQAERKAAQGSAPAYMYVFSWQTPVLNGRPRAFHCSEIPFVFNNTDVSAFATGGTAEARELGAKVSEPGLISRAMATPTTPGCPNGPRLR